MTEMTFYFYDLETSGFDAREARIMQFAGQRTNLDLQPIGDPHNFLIRLSEDVLPEPDAVLVTGITPQQTRQEGITEAEFLRFFTDEVAKPDTVMVGFNNVRFDDEFMRFTHYRNFYDAYEWQWKDGRGKWDLLDVVRMTRALRPDGIEWPVDSDGKPTNRLELLAAVNKLDHTDAHDALSDVKASLELARLLKAKQPKLFGYLLEMRDKQKVAKLTSSGEPFVYSSGRYPSQYHKTTVVAAVDGASEKQGVLVFDLRVDPGQYTGLSIPELVKLWQARGPDAPYMPVKMLRFNRCPAVAPMGVLDEGSQQRLQIDLEAVTANYKKLRTAEGFGDKLVASLEKARPKQQAALTVDELKVDSLLYDGFVNDSDKTKMSVVRAAAANELADLNLEFTDERLQKLLPLYKARNFPRSLGADEQKWWDDFKARRLLDGGQQSRAARFFRRLEELSAQKHLTSNQQYLLKELELYAQAILPIQEA